MLPLSPRRRRLVIKLGSVLVLLLAVMPQVLYLGHPARETDGPTRAAATTGHEHHEQAAAEHAGHCHVGPKGCAGADGVTNVALLASLISMMPEGHEFDTLENREPVKSFVLWQRPEKPPRTV
jgi:hypothetical protein